MTRMTHFDMLVIIVSSAGQHAGDTTSMTTVLTNQQRLLPLSRALALPDRYIKKYGKAGLTIYNAGL